MISCSRVYTGISAMRLLRGLLLLGVLLSPAAAAAEGLLQLPVQPSPESYGNVLMEPSGDKKADPVLFSHWRHRVKFTCRVCHYELGFSMKANDTPITCDNGRMRGQFCARCHDGKISFAPKDEKGENCGKCHNVSISANWKELLKLQRKLPKSSYGNKINWTRALAEGLIKPKDSLYEEKRELINLETLTLHAEMSGISSAVFPHKTHELWLDCSSCHPELFNIKKKSTQSLRMSNMLKGESCGVCHLRVAFPLNDCRKCHPDMKVH